MFHNSFERGIKGQDLGGITGVLEKWLVIVEQTAKSWMNDKQVPWWYNERASLSLLAGAIWQQKGFAFEEYTVYRKVNARHGVPYKYGRCDIEFQFGQRRFIAEAKQCWPALGRTKSKAMPIINSCRKQAKHEVGQLWERGYHSLAVVFIVPRIPTGYQAEDVMVENISSLIEQVAATKKTLAAWVFPKITRELHPADDSPDHNYIYPGVILAVTSCEV